MSAQSGQDSQVLQGKRVAFVGKLAGMSKRQAARLVRQHGAVVVQRPDPSIDLAVVGDDALPAPQADELEQWFDEATREAARQGTLRVLSETQLWEQLGLVEQGDLHRLYTPAMLAEMLDVPVAVVRRWHRRGLIAPALEVRKLPYFDFREVATARRLAQLLAAGLSPRQLERRLEALARYLPGVERPLAQLSVIVEGKQILLRQGDGLIEPGGQLRFDFEAWEREHPERPASIPPGESAPPSALPSEPAPAEPAPASAEQIRRLAVELEEEGQLTAAAETYRAALAAGGPDPEICFQLAELLYRLGDLAAARERYYMAIELDEDYVEARANLGCVLAETGQRDLAVAAFEGALAYHADYADVHYQLARLLDEMGQRDQAEEHWRAFLELAPTSRWADEARARLGR